MSEAELTKGILKYLEQDALNLKQMALENKQNNEILRVTMDNLKETLLDIKQFMKGVSEIYVTTKEFEENKADKDAVHNAIWERVKRLEWGFITLGCGAISSLLGLIIWMAQN